MLAQSLWALSALFLLSLPSTLAQSTQIQLSFDTPVTLTGGNFSTTSTPLVFSLPSSSQITISIALCAAASSTPPHIYVTNSSSDSQVVIPGPAGGLDVFEVTFNSLSLGNFTLDLLTGDPAAGVLAVYGGTTSDSLEIGVSQGGERVLLCLNKSTQQTHVSSSSPIIKATEPLHAPLGDLPFFADSTANQALLFSPPFLPPAPDAEATYPNYTLPQANTTAPDPPSTTPNLTLFLAPLDAGLATTTLPQTACAIRARVTGDASTAQSAQVLQEQLWLRDETGWRREWLVGRLAPLTNYSVYAIQDGTRLSGPIYFATKSGA